MKALKVVFPEGPCDQKSRYLIRGFQGLGIPVEIPSQGPKIGVTPFSVHFEDGTIAICGHDIGCREKHRLSRGTGEEHPWFEAARGPVFFFKVHAHPLLLGPAGGIFPMPQALGRDIYLEMIKPLREKRAKEGPSLDVFGIFAAGGQRAEACRRIQAGPWESLVGIGRGRKGEPPPPRDVSRPLLSAPEYFEAMARTRLALSLPSHGMSEGPWCSYRHVEAWALGVPVLTFAPRNYAVFGDPAPRPWIEIADDLSDLQDAIAAALGDKERLEEIGQAGADYFDAHFTPERHAGHVLETIEANREKP